VKVDLDGQVALVTGAARGIGRAIADTLAGNGAQVVYSDIDGLEELAGVDARRLDVTDVDEARAVIDAVVADHGRLDILVNNAGVNTAAHRVTIDEFPKSEWDRLLAVDLDGPYHVSRAAIPAMRRQGGGRIVNIASIAGLVPLRLQSAFVAAKAGVVNLGSAGILVNAVAPGSTLTEGTRQLFYGEDGQFHASMQELLDHIPLGRPGDVQEIAHAVLFLAAPESSYINGHVLVVDGGWTAGYVRNF
jgi:3-oxoacyl-[acyl-carrier protein] reductase